MDHPDHPHLSRRDFQILCSIPWSLDSIFGRCQGLGFQAGKRKTIWALLLVPLVFFPMAQGAVVTLCCTNSVVLNNIYGKLTPSVTESVDMFALYANGTDFFQVTNTYKALPFCILAFQVTPYGNGTLQIRVSGPQPTFLSTKTSSANSYLNGYEQIQYTGNTAEKLELGWPCIGFELKQAAFLFTLAFSTLLVAGFIRDYTEAYTNKPEKEMFVVKEWLGIALSGCIIISVLFITSGFFTV